MAVPGSAEAFACNELKRGVFAIAKDFGFTSIQEKEAGKLAELWRRLLVEYGEKTAMFMQAAGRTQANESDVIAALKFCKVNISDVKEYAEQTKVPPLPALPNFPYRPKLTDEEHFEAMYGPRPSARELAIRPPHIPDYLPAMHPEWIEEEKQAEASSSSSRKKKKKGEKREVKLLPLEVEKPKAAPKKQRLPSFSGADFHSLGFITDEEEESSSVFNNDISAATGITSSSNVPGPAGEQPAQLETAVQLDTSIPLQSPAKEDSKNAINSDALQVTAPVVASIPSQFLEMLKARINSPAPADRPSSSASVHSNSGSVKQARLLKKAEKLQKKANEPKPEPKPKGRPPKKKDDNQPKKKKVENQFLVNQQKQLDKFREEKEKREREVMAIQDKKVDQVVQEIKNATAKLNSSTSSPNPLKVNLGKPPKFNFGEALTIKVKPVTLDVASSSAAATPPMPFLAPELSPTVGAEVSITTDGLDGEETLPRYDTAGIEGAPTDFSSLHASMTSILDNTAAHTIDSTLNTTSESVINSTMNTTAASQLSSEDVKAKEKEKKKKHKDKNSEREGSPSEKAHKKKDKNSEEYKEYKKMKKEKKRREKEEKERKEKEEALNGSISTKCLIKFKPDSAAATAAPTLSPVVPLSATPTKLATSLGTPVRVTPPLSMRPESRSSERPGSSRKYDKEPAAPPLKLKFKNLFSAAELEKNEQQQKVPPVKLAVTKPQPSEEKSQESASTPTKSKKEKKDKEKKKERKEKERHLEKEKRREQEKDAQRAKEKEREREREREREKEKEREARRDEERELLRKKEIERENQRLLDKKKEQDKKDQEKREAAERAREAEKAERLLKQKEADKERERQKRKEEKKKEKKLKKRDRSRSKDSTPVPPSRPIVPILSADDDEEDDDDDEEEVWICPVCSVAYTEGANMVCCDSCDDWFHWHCVGLLVEPAKNNSWFCQRCSGKKKHKELKRPGSRSEEVGAPKKKKKH